MDCRYFSGNGYSAVCIDGKSGKITPMRALSQEKTRYIFKPPKCSSIPKTPVYHTGIATDNIGGQTVCGNGGHCGNSGIFMMTIQILGGVVDSESARESMGEIVSDVEIQLQTKVDEHEFQNIEQTIEEITPIQKKCYTNTTYMSLNGEEIYCFIYQNPGDMQMTKGVRRYMTMKSPLRKSPRRKSA